MLADSHCHLDWFENSREIAQKALASGVGHILTNSTNSKNIAATLELAHSISGVHAAIGIHPVDLLSMNRSEIDAAFAFVEKNVSKASAIGEIGMDYKRAATAEQKNMQEGVFRRFVKLAMDNNRSVCVHARYAETACLDILEQMGAQKVHLHWFTNSKKTTARAVSLGYTISCGPIIMFDDASAGIVKEIPLENLMLETDAPVEFGGEKAEPSWILKVCQRLAQLKGVSEAEVAEKTGSNFKRLFLSKKL